MEKQDNEADSFSDPLASLRTLLLLLNCRKGRNPIEVA